MTTEVRMGEQAAAGDARSHDGVPREHPEEPAEGADRGQNGSEDPDVPRQHAQEPAEGASEPGNPT